MNALPLFIIDNVTISREMLSALFSAHFKPLQQKNIHSFNSAESFLYNVAVEQTGCILLDNRLPGIDGISLQTTLNQRKSPLSFIFYTDSMTVFSAVAALKAGAVDILSKSTSDELLVKCVKKAMLISKQKAKELDLIRQLEQLTKREKAVLDEMLKGIKNQQIAQNLGISLRTVEVHRANMLKKLAVNNSVELAIKVAKIIT